VKRIKVCHLIDGSNTNPLLYRSIKYSDRDKFEYTVISLEPSGGLQEQMANLGVHSFSLNYRSRRQAPQAFLRLVNYFRRERFDIVQTHLFDASLIGLAAAKLGRVPVRIFTGHHSHETPLYDKKWLTFLDGSSGRWLATHTIAPSRQMKNIFVEKFGLPEGKVSVLHHGFDLEEWRREAGSADHVREELGLENKVIWGAVGRLFWVKNFERLLRGFAAATKGNDSIVLVIVGGGEFSGLLELAQQLSIEKKVIFTGRRDDIGEVMNSFDVFIHPSLAESFGMVFIEAMALGKPLVSTPVGIGADVLSDGRLGLLLHGFEESDISDGIIEMLSLRNQWPIMGKAAAEAADEFDIRTTQQACDKAYFRWVGKNE
jgi:glycosyltransferase involved in cell wall biosynthesis